MTKAVGRNGNNNKGAGIREEDFKGDGTKLDKVNVWRSHTTLKVNKRVGHYWKETSAINERPGYVKEMGIDD